MPHPAPSTSGSHRLDRLAIGRVAVLLLLVTGTGLGLLFGPVSWQVLAKPGQVVYHEDGFQQLALALTPARLLGLRLAVGISLALGVAGWLMLRGQRAGVGRQLRTAIGRLRRYWQRLPGSARGSTLAVMAIVMAARLYYLVAYPLSTDEIASFDYFVSQGPRVIFSYYPIPNNHLLYNLLAWPLSLTGLPPSLVMRLPTWLLGSASLPLVVSLLGRVIGLRRALVGTLLVGLAPLDVYYGAVGRGYGLQLVMLQLGFFAVLQLLRPASGYRQLAWAALELSSIVGLLLVPSYVYPLSALLLGLAVGICRAKNWSAIGSLALAAGAIGAIALLLYTPIGAVSGWDRLLANRYVSARAATEFWSGFRPRLYEVAAELLVPSVRVSGPLLLGLALLGGAIGSRLTSGLRRRAALLTWLLVALPIVLLVAQRVFPLARVLLYVPWAGCVWLLVAWPRGKNTRGKNTGRVRPWAMRLAIMVLAGLGLFRLYWQTPGLRGLQNETYLVQQAYHWLQQTGHSRGLGPVVGLQAPIHELFFAHYLALAPHPNMRLVSYRAKKPTVFYDFIVLTHAAAATGCRVPATYVASYSDDLVTIYTHPIPHPQPIRLP